MREIRPSGSEGGVARKRHPYPYRGGAGEIRPCFALSFFTLKSQVFALGSRHIIMNWLVFALMTVASWGVYGIFLHTGQMGMKDAVNGRYKAFLFVGLAYFLTAVLAPLVLLLIRGADWNYPRGGMIWSLVAGGARGTPACCRLSSPWGR